MPREQLRALAADVDRLIVAGAGSVPGDEGLRRRETSLRDLGKKVPALAKVAEVVGRAAGADAAGAPRALLDLLLVVGQVRAGLATAGLEGPIEPAGPSGPWSTPAPARDLYPIVTALTQKGSGRVEALKEAAGRGGLGDLRLVDSLLAALDDPGAEFADAVAAEALPALGPAILPDLRRDLDLRGKAADARRLAAVAAIDPGAGADLCRRAIAEGSAAVRSRALEALASIDPEEATAIALGLLAPLATAGAPAAGPDAPPAKGKRPAKSAPRPKLDKTVRDAAMACLGKSTRDEALEILVAAIREVDGPEVYGHAASHSYLPGSPHPRATDRLLGELARIAAASRAARQKVPKGKGKSSAAKEAECGAGCLLSILGDRGDRRAAPALIDLLAHPSPDLRKGAADALVSLEDPAGLEAAAALVGDDAAWGSGIQAAWRLPPGPRFERLASLCRDLSAPKKKDRERGEALLSEFDAEDGDDRRTDWDPRWADALRPHVEGPEGRRVALALEVVLGAGAIPDLIRALGLPGEDWHGSIRLAQALGRLGAREAVGPLINRLGKDANYHSISEALKAIGDPSAILALTELVKKVRDRWRKALIETLIDELSKLSPS